MATIRKMPTPMATAKISTRLGMEGICRANTCRSGSAMVMITPSRKQANRGSRLFLDLCSCTPMPTPKGCMDVLEPMVNRAIPKISNMVPKRKRSSRSRKTQSGSSLTSVSLFCKKMMSEVTSVPALALKVLFGKRTAPRSSALCAIYFLTAGFFLSIVPDEVIKAMIPPGRTLSRVLHSDR